jgi:hypothetical protein
MEAVASQYALRGVRKLEAEQGSCCIISYIVDGYMQRKHKNIRASRSVETRGRLVMSSE